MSRVRAVNLHFLETIPKAINFSDLPEGMPENIPSEDKSNTLLEYTILQILAELTDDRSRAIVLLQILRSLGYNFDHKSCAKIFGVKLRWYMRLINSVRERLKQFRS